MSTNSYSRNVVILSEAAAAAESKDRTNGVLTILRRGIFTWNWGSGSTSWQVELALFTPVSPTLWKIRVRQHKAREIEGFSAK